MYTRNMLSYQGVWERRTEVVVYESAENVDSADDGWSWKRVVVLRAVKRGMLRTHVMCTAYELTVSRRTGFLSPNGCVSNNEYMNECKHLEKQ